MIPNALIESVQRQEAVLFAGAGISQSALGVTGLTVRDAIGLKIRKDYPDYQVERRTFEDVCDEFAALNSRITLVNELSDLIPQNVAPTDNLRFTAKCFRYILTTNWDQLFEEAIKELGGKFRVLSSAQDAPNFNYDSTTCSRSTDRSSTRSPSSPRRRTMRRTRRRMRRCSRTWRTS